MGGGDAHGLDASEWVTVREATTTSPWWPRQGEEELLRWCTQRAEMPGPREDGNTPGEVGVPKAECRLSGGGASEILLPAGSIGGSDLPWGWAVAGSGTDDILLPDGE